MFEKIDRGVDRLAFAVSIVSYIGTIAIMVLNVCDVLLTKMFKAPIIGSYEITQYILLCVIFAAFAYGQTNKTHINMTIIIGHFPKVLKFLIFAILQAASTAIVIILAYAAFTQAQANILANKMTDVLYIPIFPFMIVEGICMVVFAITLLWDTVLAFAALGSAKAEAMVTKSWD